MKIFQSFNEDDTIKLAFNFAKSMIKFPCVILIDGDLGAGKTVFAKGFAKGLEIHQDITSPTFTLMNEYECLNDKKFKHFDFYRIEDEQELYAIGFDEAINENNSISLIEWASNAPNLCKNYDYKIKIIKIKENERKIIIGAK